MPAKKGIATQTGKFLLICSMMLLPYSACVETVAQNLAEWPCFHGPDRSNKSTETGLKSAWPEEGPEVLWSVDGLGKGYSTVSIAEGLLFTAGLKNQQTYVFAFDLDGRLVWEKPNGRSWETEKEWARAYNGSRSTPSYSQGIVYQLGELGRLSAFNSRNGDLVWSLELREQFEAEIPEYAYAESVFIEGDRLYCCPAGKKGYIVCLNKHTGELIWSNSEIPGTVGFSSLISFDQGGYHQLAGLSSNTIFGVDSETGNLLWQVPYENSRSNNVADPIYHDGHIFASSGYGKGSTLIKLSKSGNTITPETVWQTELLDNHHGGVILHDGYLYGSGHNVRGWFCLDFRTGKQMWKTGGKGSLTYADHMLYSLDERGIMNLIKATPDTNETRSTFELPSGGKSMYWAHPVVCGGRLYVRHEDSLFAYDIRSAPE
jgi:outer membrane protein assembly factor BamB